MKWERKHLEPDKKAAVRHATMRPDSSGDRGFFGALGRGRLAVLRRASGEAFRSALRNARKGVAGRFLRVCDVVRSKQCSETKLQRSGGPGCRI